MSENSKALISELSMIAHEFRRPLDTISKSAELVNRSSANNMLDNEKLGEIMNGIITSCHRLGHLTTQIMNLAHIENDNVRVIAEQYDAAVFMAQMHKLVALYEAPKNVKFSFVVKLKDPEMICDFKKLEVILLNLISNAVKYSRDKNRRVVVKTYEEDEHIVFSVKDNGVGIALHEQKKIFETFYRVESFETRTTEGSGLGLAIVKSYVDILGGRLTLESEVGKGSEFIVKIPRTQKHHYTSDKLVELSPNYHLYKSTVDEAFADI